MLTKDVVKSDYNYLKNKAIDLFQKDEIEKCVKYIETTARVGYKFNFRYCDDELESLIEKLGESILKGLVHFESSNNRIIFFDSFANTTVLTIQYLRAIFSWKAEVLFITTKDTINGELLKELKEYSLATIYIINGATFEEKLQNVGKRITEFKPQKVFLHFTPWDILGFALWSNIKSCDRFFINLTDHAYWLGKNCIDYLLEFRNYGVFLSEKHRGISSDKLLLQPYYPIESKESFKGFPIDTKNKVIAFSGSSYYKIYGDNYRFLNLIKQVLDNNEDLLFLFAGSGNSKPLEKFIVKNNLQEKFFLLGHRSDIGEVVKNIDIYVNTYPMIGGLMSQYAAMYSKPMIGYTSENLFSYNDVEGLLGIEQKGILVKKSEKDFLSYFNKLVKDLNARQENIDSISNAVLTESDFNDELKDTVDYKSNMPLLNSVKVKVDLENVFEFYLESENRFLKGYGQLLCSNLRFDVLKFKPYLFVEYIFLTKLKSFFLKKIGINFDE